MVRASGELSFVFFTDDTNLFTVELFGKGNRGLGKLGKWVRSNRFTLNLKKTEYVYFSRTRPPEVLLGGLEYDREQIRRVEGAGFLGVWIDARIKWRGHVGQVKTKVRQL
jgi:hypothetical protein